MKYRLLLICFFIKFANASLIYPELIYGGKNFGRMLIKVEGNKYISKNQLHLGKCKGNILNDFGKINYNEDKETLYIIPNKECLDRQEITYSKKQKLKFIDTKSFYINYSYRQDNFNNKTLNIQSGLFLFDSFLYSDFYTNFKDKLHRNQTYWLKDFTNRLARLKIGDTFLKSYMLVNQNRLFGLSLYTATSVNPNVKLYRTFEQDITITYPSIVEVYSNGTLIDRKELPAGIYSFKDLPVSSFNNDVEIKIINKATLKENIIKIPFLFSPKILKKEKWDYSFSIGLKRENENEYKGFSFGGYVRYGLLDNLTPGISFNEKQQAIHIDFADYLGLFTAGINTNKKYLLSYKYSNKNYGYGISYQRKDFRLYISISTQKFGGFAIQYHKDGKESVGISYSNNLWKGNFNASILRINKDYQFRLGYTLPLGTRPNIVALQEYIKKKEKQTRFRYSYTFKEQDEKSIGVDLSYTNTKSDLYSQNQYNFTFNTKYINLFRFNAYKFDKSKANYNFTISGSFACVGLMCRIGEPINYGAFAVGNHLSTSYRKAYGVINLIPYFYSTIRDDRDDYTSITEKITPRFGQGISLADKKVIKAVVYYNGKPLKLTDLKVNGEDNFTGKNGEIIIETSTDTLEIELFGKTYITKLKNNRIEIKD